MKRQAWVVLRDGGVIGAALNREIAYQAVRNCRRYDKANASTHPPEYDVVCCPVYTKRFVAPKGYAKEVV